MLSNCLILCRPLLLLPSVFPSIRVFSNESALHIRWLKYWSLSFNISPSNEYSGLPINISFRMDWFLSPCCPRDSQESSPTPQFKSINSSVLSLLYSPTFTSMHDYWKNHSSLTRQTFVGKVMSLLLNMLSRLVITFLKWAAAAAAAKLLQLCPTLCNPIEAAHQAPPSLGFFRQEHWSGLPFPSPMHENEKWKWSRSVMSDSQWPHGLQPTRLLRPWDLPGKSTGVVATEISLNLLNQ